MTLWGCCRLQHPVLPSLPLRWFTLELHQCPSCTHGSSRSPGSSFRPEEFIFHHRSAALNCIYLRCEEENCLHLLLPLYVIYITLPAVVRGQITPMIYITASDSDNKRSGHRATRLLISVLSSFGVHVSFIPTGFCVSATGAHNKPSRSKCRRAQCKAATGKRYVREHHNYSDNMQPMFFFRWRVLRTGGRQIGRAIERGRV